MDAWARAKAVFLDALDRPEAERAAFAAAACHGDPELLREVESLLASDATAGHFCETPAAALLHDLFVAPACSPLAAGTRIAHYEIIGFIGSGGMGEVYLARDGTLGREVALKTVAPLATPEERLRLVKEARHASILSHPHICTIYEAGEFGERPYIAMEYVDGRSLREILAERPLPIARAIGYGIQVADALHHAHTRGIVHRDLKSANVVIGSTDRPVVLDFGLAKRLPQVAGPSTEPSLTVHGALAGTLSHMAPEVLLGRPADARSDVWAIGVLLYEMVTGRLPFTGSTPFETSSAILSEPPAPIESGVPLALRLVIERCLEKNPSGRYQCAAAVKNALQTVREGRRVPLVRQFLACRRSTLAAAAAIVLSTATAWIGGAHAWEYVAARSQPPAVVAVLPFENVGGTREAAYYLEGLTDAVTSELGAIADVRVLARTSAARLGRGSAEVSRIRQQVGASAIVRGTVRTDGEHVELAARLVDAASGTVLWSGRYRRHRNEVLVLQADVLRELTTALDATLRPGAVHRLAMVRTVTPAAYEAFLKGRYAWNQRTPESLKEAVQHYTRAIELDATYAPAHAALADCYNLLGTVMVGDGSPREYRPKAAAAALKALQIDPDSAEAHAALGYVRHYELRWEDAERAFRRAIELNPSHALVRLWYANMLMSKRRFPEALEQVTTARELDPFSLVVNTNVGWVLASAGRREEAVAHLRKTRELDPSYIQAQWRFVSALTWTGRHEEALEEAENLARLARRTPPSLAVLVEVNARAGRRDEAQRILRELIEVSRRQYVPPASLATAYTITGDLDAALSALERAFEEGSNAIAYLAVDRSHGPLRGHPRFESLLARAGLGPP